jgi:hypothetical protein
MSIAYDTHAAAKDFQRAGFTEAQVEALVENARRTAVLPDIGSLATKADLANVVAVMATKTDIANIVAVMATKTDIANIVNVMATKADIANMATKADIANMATKVDIAELRTEIAAAKLQAITVILSGMALIMASGTILSRLIR